MEINLPKLPDLGAVNETTRTFCIDGHVMWLVWMHRWFWHQVAIGEIGLNPRKLFRRDPKDETGAYVN